MGPHFFHVRGSTHVWEGKGLLKADFEGYLPYTTYHLNFRFFFFNHECLVSTYSARAL